MASAPPFKSISKSDKSDIGAGLLMRSIACLSTLTRFKIKQLTAEYCFRLNPRMDTSSDELSTGIVGAAKLLGASLPLIRQLIRLHILAPIAVNNRGYQQFALWDVAWLHNVISEKIAIYEADQRVLEADSISIKIRKFESEWIDTHRHLVWRPLRSRRREYLERIYGVTDLAKLDRETYIKNRTLEDTTILQVIGCDRSELADEASSTSVATVAARLNVSEDMLKSFCSKLRIRLLEGRRTV